MRNIIFGFDDKLEELLKNWGLLLLRLGVGFDMIFSHGLGKLERIGADPIKFSDPYGLGPTVSLLLAVFAEFFCSIAVVAGFMTRFAVIPLSITMLTAIFIIHTDDPWQKKEFAMMFLIPYLTLLFAGPGKLSVDHLLKSRNKPTQ